QAYAASQWTVVAAPDTSATEPNQLGGVSCASAGFCAAVGSSWNGSNQRTLAERWDGSSWSIVTSADPDGTQDDYLTGVSCVRASFCAAVGYSSDGSGSRPLADG